MSVKYICNICNEEIKLCPDDCPDMMTIIIRGKRYVRIGTWNKVKYTERKFHVHESECYKKFLNIFKRREK